MYIILNDLNVLIYYMVPTNLKSILGFIIFFFLKNLNVQFEICLKL